MDEQVTFRLPAELLREIEKQAEALRVPKSMLVREALAAYMAARNNPPTGVWDRVKDLVGSVEIDPSAVERDALAATIRRHNWRGK